MTSPIRDALRDHLVAAMRARDRQTAGAVRSVLGALENAEAVPVTSGPLPAPTSEHVAGAAAGAGAGEAPRRVLSPEDERAVVERELAELNSSAAVLAAAGQLERSAELDRVAAIVAEVLTR